MRVTIHKQKLDREVVTLHQSDHKACPDLSGAMTLQVPIPTCQGSVGVTANARFARRVIYNIFQVAISLSHSSSLFWLPI